VFGHVTQFDLVTGPTGFRANVDGAQHDEWYDYDTYTILPGSASQLTDIVADDTLRAEVSVSQLVNV
jgi:hypothetical protein